MLSHDIVAFWTPSMPELVVVLILALLLFGKRLPEVAKNLGKGVVEFKKGIKGVEDKVHEVEHEVDNESNESSEYQAPKPLSESEQQKA